MDEEILSDIRNKMTAPKIALEKLAKGEEVPREFLALALRDLKKALGLLEELYPPDLKSLDGPIAPPE